jgi:hypothetical protein
MQDLSGPCTGRVGRVQGAGYRVALHADPGLGGAAEIDLGEGGNAERAGAGEEGGKHGLVHGWIF